MKKFRVSDDFRTFDDNKQPYSFLVERHTQIDNLHAAVENGEFHLKSVGNRHILNAPAFRNGRLEFEFRLTFLEEEDPQFIVLFQYDQVRRIGMGIRLHYRLYGGILISLVSVYQDRIKTIQTEKIEPFLLTDNVSVLFALRIQDNQVYCCLDTHDVIFSCVNKPGKIAIDRDRFVGEFIFRALRFESEDEFSPNVVLPRVNAEIPCVNGGDIPYMVSWEVEEIAGEKYLRCILDGGTKTRKLNREDRIGQYAVERDIMTNPYVGICVDGSDFRFHLLDGENYFVDPNIYWECLKEYFHDTQLPVQACFRVFFHRADADIELIFGYERLRCTGYGSQQGGREFRFDRYGKLIYSGDTLDGSDNWEIFSPYDKLVISLVPENCWHREEIMEHLKYNHYFDVSEAITFKFEYRTRKNPAYFHIRAELCDVFERNVLKACEVPTEYSKWHHGYQCLRAEAQFGTLDVGVYRIRFLAFYGDKVYQTAVAAFEVYDQFSKENPAIKTGLPFTFSMPNEQKWLMRNSFDLWSPARSCDVEHFITCVTDTPIEAETRRVWEVLKTFNREWFAWLGVRTCNDFDSSRHEIVKKEADYLFFGIDSGSDDKLGSASIFPFGLSAWKYERMAEPFMKKTFRCFLDANLPIAQSLKGQTEPLSRSGFERLMTEYWQEWQNFLTDSVHELFCKQNQEFLDKGIRAKRCMYGPITPYTNPTQSYHTLSAYCLPCEKTLADDIYTGFCIFEDYPYSCAYQTFRGPFDMMTIKLHIPNLKIYPEQYQGGLGGCIDGAVKFAHAPMGAYQLSAYQNSTHAFEYVFNTPYLLSDGFHYWQDYGFHRSDCRNDFMNQLVRDWYYVLHFKPARPLRSMAFLVEYSDLDNTFQISGQGEEKRYIMGNTSEAGSSIIHECSRYAGVPNGFGLKYDTLSFLSEAECDLLILPSLAEATEEQRTQIRKLFNAGVNLLAVSDVSGLEDLFGVACDPYREEVCSVQYGNQEELVCPTPTVFRYRPEKASVVLQANGHIPAIIRTERTALINTDVCALGRQDPGFGEKNANHIVGRLLRLALQDLVHDLSSPLVVGDGVGVTVFRSEAGKTVIMAIDYSPFDNMEHKPHEAIIYVYLSGVISVKSDRDVFVGSLAGQVREFRFTIATHETVFFELETVNK